MRRRAGKLLAKPVKELRRFLLQKKGMAVQCVERSRIIQSISAIVSRYSGELSASAVK